MNVLRKSAKTVDLAIEEALHELGVTVDEVTYEIIEVGSKGILGLGAKPAIVEVTVKYDPVKVASEFIKEMCLNMGIKVEIKAELDEKFLSLDLSGEDMGVLIGKRGQTLDSIQYLTNLVVNKGKASYLSVNIDTENYRKRRKETLENLAKNLAKKVKATKRNVKLEPMNPYERRIIHSILQTDKAVVTYSEGEDPYRYVVIGLKR